MRIASALALMALLWPGMAAAFCRLALVLAIDVSSSVDEREYWLQTEGLARALESQEVQNLLFAAPETPVAIHIFEWSAEFDQSAVLDWTVIETPEVLSRVTSMIRRHNRSFINRPTALGHAIGHATRQFERGPECLRRVIDVSGDGLNNEGITPTELYATFGTNRATINGLAIGDPEIADYYRREVAYGPGSFVEWAVQFEDFEETMKRKLIREMQLYELSQLD